MTADNKYLYFMRKKLKHINNVMHIFLKIYLLAFYMVYSSDCLVIIIIITIIIIIITIYYYYY